MVQKRPWLLERAKTLLLTPDLFNYFFTGEKKAEYTMVTTTQLMDAHKQEWSDEIMEALNISRELFPEIKINELENLNKNIIDERNEKNEKSIFL